MSRRPPLALFFRLLYTPEPPSRVAPDGRAGLIPGCAQQLRPATQPTRNLFGLESRPGPAARLSFFFICFTTTPGPLRRTDNAGLLPGCAQQLRPATTRTTKKTKTRNWFVCR